MQNLKETDQLVSEKKVDKESDKSLLYIGYICTKEHSYLNMEKMGTDGHFM